MDFHKLTHAVQHNDIAWFSDDQTLANCSSVSHKKTGNTVLHLACWFGRRDLLEMFSKRKGGLDLQISNYEGKKPLHDAAQFGHLECVHYLLQNEVQVDCLKRADWTPLMLACTKHQLPVISLLLSHGADPALVNKDGWNSFHIAAREGHVDVVNKLLELNPNLWNTVSQNGRTPLHTAALHGRSEAVEFLLDHCDYAPDIGDSCGVTPLMDSLRAGFDNVAQLLISKHKADVCRRDHMGRQALHHAAQAGQTKSVEFLLTNCHVSVDSATPGTSFTSLHIAAKEGQDSVLTLLIENGATVNLVDNKGRTALHIASGAQHASSVKLLLLGGAMDREDSSGLYARQMALRPQVQQAFEGHG